MCVCARVSVRTFHLPGFPLLLFGNLFDVLVIDVVLASETVNPPVQQVYSWGGARTQTHTHTSVLILQYRNKEWVAENSEHG